MAMKNLIRLMNAVWDRWDLRGLMMVSVTVQIALLVLAPLRKWTSNGWVIGSIMCLYMVSDWAANFASGVITTNHKNNQQPLALWSAFLLVHIGGPDSISAFSSQDNDFWYRHALAFVFQCVSTSYIFLQTLPHNQVWLATVLVFACGCIKSFERTRSLYLGSFINLVETIQQHAAPDYNNLLGLYFTMEEPDVTLPTRVQHQISDREVEIYGHQFFLIFKSLVANLKCSNRQRRWSRKFFRLMSAEDAFKIIAVELNNMYDILFTKANFVCDRKGFLLRLCTSALVVAAFGLFCSEETRFGGSDVVVTHALFAGTITMDAGYWLTTILPHGKLVFLRWSKSVLAYNLIHYSHNLLKPETQKIMDWIGVRSYFEGLFYVRAEEFSDKLRDYIFEEVRTRSELADGSTTTRGSFALRFSGDDVHNLYRYVDDMQYDQSLLSWHIATELCWRSDPKDSNHRDISKILSDYMLYLVVMQPAMMNGVMDIRQNRLRVRYTCHVISKILSEEDKSVPSTSLLSKGMQLADELEELGDRKWEIMSRVWVEMLTYAAVHCRPQAHAERLSKGGELISIVWLLMAHFGLMDQFEDEYHVELGPKLSRNNQGREPLNKMKKLLERYISVLNRGKC